MADTDRCPICGKPVINGICLDCGALPESARSEPALTEPAPDEDVQDRYEDRFDTETESLDDVIPPQLESMSGDEVIAPEEALKMAQKAAEPEPKRDEPSNPYANMIPYESPDYGDNYVAPQTVIHSDGIPQALKNDYSNEMNRRIRLKADKNWLGYWWLILIIFLMPYQISYFQWIALAIGSGLLKFDEKGGRQAGVIIIVIAVLKLILFEFTY